MCRERANPVVLFGSAIIPVSSETNQIKTFSDMASIAVVTEIAAMGIILFVAAAAGRRQADFFSHRGTVAGDAVEALMCAIQHIVRLLVVIECP